MTQSTFAGFELPLVEPKPEYGRGPAEFGVVRLRELAPNKPLGDCPARAYEFWVHHVATATWFRPEQECLVTLLLNTRRRVIGFNLVSIGTIDTLLCRVADLFRTGIVAAASGLVIMHNHPSGDPSPSQADIQVTRDLVRAGRLLKIDVLDHVVVGDCADGRVRPYCSLRELGYWE